MYAFVKYNNYRKENTFEIKYISNDLEKTKSAALSAVKKDIPRFQRITKDYGDDGEVKINTKIEEYYVRPMNEILVQYNLVFVKKTDDDDECDGELYCTDSTVYAVLKLNDPTSEEEIDKMT